MDPQELLARVARRGALAARPSRGRVRDYVDRFDEVQAIAEELEQAGEFAETSTRSGHAGSWTWRAALKDLDDRPPRLRGAAPLVQE